MADTAQERPVVLAAGGTGGHIFPAEALAEELVRRGERVVLVTDKRFAKFSHGIFSRIPVHTIHAGTSGSSALRTVTGVAHLALGVWQARRLLIKLKPKAVVGFGGYPSFPTVYNAPTLGIPTVIHEQNSVLGKANRMLAHRVQVIATSFPNTLMVEERDKAKITLVGNPVRASVRALHDVPYPELQQDGKVHLLITGGSQGASIFSQIIPAAIAALPANLRSRIRIDQQCRDVDLDATRTAYEHLGVNVDLAAFFVDIPARLGISHLVIARAGASTVSELAVAGRPAILVPLPASADNHQAYNANSFEDAGAGWVMMQEGFTAAALSARLEALINNPAGLSRVAAAARRVGRIHAAKNLASLVLATTRGERFVPEPEEKRSAAEREVAA